MSSYKVDKDVESEETLNDVEEEHDIASEREESSEGETVVSSGEEMVFDNLSDDDSSSSEDELSPAVSSRKRKISRPSAVSPSPAKSNRSASPASAGSGKGSVKKKSIKRSLSFSVDMSNDKWHSADEPDIEPTQQQFRPLRTPGPQVISTASYSPLQFFHMFFSSRVMQKIIEHSNAYGAKCLAAKRQSWCDISLKDFKSFLALIVYMGLVKCFNLTDYWKKSDIYSLPYPVQVMSCRRFLAISSALHLSDPEEDAENEKKKGTAGYDRLFKIKPLYKDIKEACQTYFHPFQNISVDERMVASKARNGLKQYMKNKPTKWGYKLFVLADSLSGYTWDFFVYEGKSDTKQGKGVGYDTVMRLVNEKSLGTGYKLFVDNFYTTPMLFRDLLSKKILACGTVRANRIGRSTTAAPRGNIRWFRDDNLLLVEWKDRRNVLLCSTFHKAFNGDKVKRKVKGGDGVWTEEEFTVPPAVLDYNKHMGGVDLSDALIGYYKVLHKTRKWYRTFFYHFVDIAVVNAFILHQHVARSKNQKPMTQKEFREALVSELAGICPVSAPGPNYTNPKHSPNNSHMPKYVSSDSTAGRRRCKLCHLKTPLKCVTCDVSLCFVTKRQCFIEWHKSGNYKEEGNMVNV
ncbi:piggyBac transposable element-derived protein 4-like [Triplophysa rosa]|uniref:piggyBac transposable element-derived protein 4-like n=1 Tax=Triplophysa rosa TaxID=992332 RepID=UPI0025461CBE|nr:piggyBac transposable element-derived protein 4-like [Triplophysa rosa]XP_057182271.1 piggyBac transposable element-derived protein 4-like [Triplophysa rosa]